MTGQETDSEIDVESSDSDTLDPPRGAVVLHNDDFTTMEFVIEVLRRFFRLNEEQAHQVMLQVHQQGKGVAGVFALEIAETKAMQVRESARAKGFPLKCTVEEVQ